MIFFYIIYAFLFINLFLNYNNFNVCIMSSLSIWLNFIFPSFFVLFILSSFLIRNKYFIKFCSVLKIFFNFDSPLSYSIYVCSFFTGNPTSTKFIQDSYTKNYISHKDYHLLLSICKYTNPLFIISLFSYKFYIVYFISLFISSIIFSKRKLPYSTFFSFNAKSIELCSLVIALM